MKLKGDIKITKGKSHVEATDDTSRPQIRVSTDFFIHGVDLSEGWPEGASVGTSEAMDEQIYDVMESNRQSLEADLKAYFEGLHKRYDMFSKTPFTGNDLLQDYNFLGLECEANLSGAYDVKTKEQAQSMYLELTVSAYYDAPVGDMESLIEAATNRLIGK